MSKIFSKEILDNHAEETPFFLFSKKEIKKTYHEYKNCFPDAWIHYAMKANSEPEVLQLLKDEGAGFEVASVHELEMLKEIGVKVEKIIYGTSVKSLDNIRSFFMYGVDRFAFDSLPELEKIAMAAPGSKVFVRVVVNDAGSVFKFSEKFGTELKNVLPFLERARELGLQPYGISFHVGSQASNPKAWAEAIENLIPIIINLQNSKIKIEVLNIGGGFPCTYESSESELNLVDISKFIFEAFEKLPYKPKLLLEPGRGMIACTGVLVTRVIAKIERPGSTWLFLDAGVYNALFEAMAYQGSTRYRITSLRGTNDSGESMFALAGPTGDSPDIITKEALLPKDTDVGDKLVIHNVGAYSLTVTSRFNGFPKPDVYFI